MRKLIAAIIISALTLALAGCSRNNNSGSSASDGSSASSDSTSDQDSANSSGTSSENDSDASGNGGTSSEANSSETENNSDENSANGEFADEAHRLADIVQNAVEFPAMTEITEPEDIQTVFGIDTDLCVEYAFIHNLMSVHLNEIVVLLPAAECEDELLEQLTNRFEYIRNEAAFYPEQETSAAGAVMGTAANGYLYLIVHENGSEAQEALLAAIG